MDSKTHINFWYVVVAVLLLLTMQAWWEQTGRVETIPYSEFQALLEGDELQEISISSTKVRGKLKRPGADGHEYIETVRIEPEFAKDLATHDVEFSGVIQSSWIAQVLSWIYPPLYLLGSGCFSFVTWPIDKEWAG